MNSPRLKKNKKICYVLAYKAPDYVRTRVLTRALADLPDVELYTAINSTRSAGRYLQTLWRLLVTRLRNHPDIYILGFRGQEIFWPVRLLTIGKPLVFDEFINPHDWLGEENNKLPAVLVKIADWYEKLALKSSRLVLTDTDLGAKKSAETYKVPLEKFRTIYVGTDESLFEFQKTPPKNKELEVFFYGNMAPLHGLAVILEAAAMLKDGPVHFTIVGGRGRRGEVRLINNFVEENRLKNITHQEWINFDELPGRIAASDLFVGGPFGNTSQAKRVITGKTFQALAVGTPTVIGQIDEEVGFHDKQNCLLVRQGSAEELAKTIAWAARNRDKLEGIGKSGRKLFEEKFSTKVVEGQLDKIINEVAS